MTGPTASWREILFRIRVQQSYDNTVIARSDNFCLTALAFPAHAALTPGKTPSKTYETKDKV